MSRLVLLEFRRMAKTRSTWMLAVFALTLSVLLSVLVISFAQNTHIDNNGKTIRCTGIDAIRMNRELSKPIEGSLTPEKTQAAFETYHKVYATYGEKVPKDVYYQKIAPINPILYRVQELYVDDSTGNPIPLQDISSQEAADFYEQRAKRLENFLSQKYKDMPDAIQKALAMNAEVKTPFQYIYGVGNSDTSDYLTLCIFLLVIICTVITAPVFSADYQSGADDVLRCTKFGRKQLAIAKMLSAMLLSTAIFAGCIFAFLLISYAAFGWDSLKTTLQIFSALSIVPFTIEETNKSVVFAGLLTFLATICFTLFLSTKFKNPLITLSIAIGTCLLPTILSSYANNGNVENWLRLCLPSGGVGFGNSFYYELTEIHFLPFNSVSVWTPNIIIAASAIEIVLFFSLAIPSYCKHESK